MRYFLTILFICSFQFVFGQQLEYKSPFKKQAKPIDKSAILKKQAEQHSLAGTIYCRPLYIANNTMVSSDEIDPDLAKNISVLQAPASVKKYGYIGVSGTVEITTNQKINKISLSQIRQQKYPQLEGKIIYAINGFFVKNTDLAISSASLIETELIKIDEDPLLNSEYYNSTCICIWTITKEQRANPELLCPRQLTGCYMGERSFHPFLQNY